MLLVHATCIDVAGAGVLLRGPSGSGKSDLALRLIDEGAVLVADDQVKLHRDGAGLSATAPPVLAGLLEVRGLGLMRLPVALSCPVRLVIDLEPVAEIERLPSEQSCDYLGVCLPLFRLAPFEASAVAKVRLAVRLATGDIISANE